MWSDELHKKMEEAENNSNSSDHEKAWEKMKFLLDEHLPVKKKRRRFIFLLFPLLIGAGITFFLLQKKETMEHPISQQKSNTIQNPATSSKNTPLTEPSKRESSTDTNDPASVSKEVTNSNTISADQTEQPNRPSIKDNDFITDKAATDNPIKDPVQKKQFRQVKKITKRPDFYKNQKQADVPDHRLVVPKQDDVTKNNEEKKNSNEPAMTKVDSISVINLPAATSKSKTDTAANQPITTVKRSPKKKSSFNNNLSFSFSIGPDISSVGLDRPGKLALPYGVGISYAVSKKISIRTGFFAGKKIYDADSADYNPPANFWNYYTNLQKIEANCFVYEIPLSVVYNFSSTEKHNWFISGGLSSYLMKKEAYAYYYKNSWGQPQDYHRTYKNKNNHFFSVLSLSGGYRYRLNDKVSIMAEPYVKTPLSGIGYGKVKLNSAGLMFTISVSPFQKKINPRFL